jgi:signal transduction histidine kinase
MATLSPTLSQTNKIENNARTTLRGAWLWLARAAWVLIGGAALVVYAMLVPLILRDNSYGSWQVEQSAALFGINIYSRAFDFYALFFLGLRYLALAIFLGVAFYIFWRKSNDWMAMLVSATLLTLPHTFNLGGYTENWYQYHYPWDKLLYALDGFYNGAGMILLVFVFLLFPDGQFVPRWMRWFAPTPFLLVGLIWLANAVEVSPTWDENLSWYAMVILFVSLLFIATWSQIFRYRHVSTRAQKLQTRWIVLCLASIAGGFGFVIATAIVLPGFWDTAAGTLLNYLIGLIIPTLLPLSFGVAMLRDQLWQSERVLNRAFVYFALTAILLVVYVFIIGALSEIFRRSVFGSNNFLIAAIATGVVALLFQPLRERLQRSINRFLYGQRDEPFTVLNQLGAQLENTLAPDAALPLIVETIGKTLRVSYASIELTTDNATRNTEYGTRANNLITLPLRYQNETVGELKIARRAPNEIFSAADMQLLENLARQAGAVAHTARLNAQLQQSREKIIAERENERKRLRRDLHDGLGPTLASQTLKLDAALELLHGDDSANASARKILQDVKTQTQNTVADIRRIVYELRPPALDDLGLVGALRAHLAQYNTANNLQITFDAPNELPPLSAAVQVNAYRIVLEAVNNVVRHANAKNCAVRISETGDLRLEITDDGVGLAENFRAGVGIASMRERAVELGGTFRIEGNEPHGTRVIAKLPISNLQFP